MKNFLSQIKLTGAILILIAYLGLLIAIVVAVVNLFSPNDANMGLIGAIVGGIISGSLTLLGVFLTIKVESNRKFIELYPEKRSSCDEISYTLFKYKEKFIELEQVLQSNGYGKEEIKRQLHQFDKEIKKMF